MLLELGVDALFLVVELEFGGGSQPGVEGNPIALGEPLEDLNVGLVVFADLHFLKLDLAALLDEREELSLVLGDGLHRHDQHVVELADQDLGLGGHAGLDFLRLEVVELDDRRVLLDAAGQPGARRVGELRDRS